MISRRGFLTGLVASLAAPAVIRTPGLLMPVRALSAASVSAATLSLDEYAARILAPWIAKAEKAIAHDILYGPSSVSGMARMLDDLRAAA